MFREALAGNGGMLFIFDNPGAHGIWMKNMRFPLDIIWIGADDKIIDIKTNALPCLNSDCEVLFPKSLAKYVLEVNAGFAGKNKIRIGDEVFFRP